METAEPPDGSRLRAELGNRQAIRAMVAEDLEHIPARIETRPQHLLRAHYHIVRMLDLARAASTTRLASLREAVEIVHNVEPDFEPEYDRTYFQDF